MLGNCVQLNGVLGQKLMQGEVTLTGAEVKSPGVGQISLGLGIVQWPPSPGCLGFPWDLLAACTGSGEMWCRILWEKKKWEGMQMTGSPTA